MTITFGQPTQVDLGRIMQIEQAGFTAEEAASRATMAQRIDTINDSFIVARNEAGNVVGYIVGPGGRCAILPMISLLKRCRILCWVAFKRC